MHYRSQNKYHAVKTEIDGIVYDSRKEAVRASELKIMEKAGIISDLKFQIPFLLQSDFIHDGKKYRKIEYFADATYYENGKYIVEDTKSPATRKNKEYRIKKKMLLFWHPDIIFRENL
ncbi:MAG: DUF1064 domain-containing protein [Oscillospiraceae bacterium]